VISLSLGAERGMMMILGFGGVQRVGRWVINNTCYDLQFPEYPGNCRGSMVVIEGRTVDRIKLGGWVYQMIKLSKARRSLVRRWSMMWSLVQFRVVGFGILLQEM
jgi:hypothetical protein